MKKMKIITKILHIIRQNKSLSSNIIGVILLKGAALLLSFVMTPMYLHYFANEAVLGVWYTLQSILVWILTFDLGVGNGIRNRLARALAIDDECDIRKIISSGYGIIGCITITIVFLLAIIIPFINWQKVLNTDVVTQTLSKVLLITLIGIALQFFFKIISSILMAMRKNVLANSLPVITNLLIMMFLLSSFQANDDEKFIALAFVYSVATILPLIAVTIYLFCSTLSHYRPAIKYFDRNIAKDVLFVGGKFFAIQAGLLIINSTNQVLINSIFGGAYVVQYTLYYRLFSMATMIFTLFTQPVWSEISVHYAKNDIVWIRKIYLFMLSIAIVIALGCVVVTGLLPFIFKIWIGSLDGISADRKIALIFTIWAIVEVFIAASTCIANGMTQLRCQVIFTIGAAVCKVPFTILLAKILPNWVSVIIAHTVVLLPLMIAQNAVLYKKLWLVKT